MTEIKQLKALAELDGKWRGMDEYREDYAYIRSHGAVQSLHGMIAENLPSYLTSYNAIIPLIQKQPSQIQCRVEVKLQDMNGDSMAWNKTPSQLCEALLRATRKWKE